MHAVQRCVEIYRNEALRKPAHVLSGAARQRNMADMRLPVLMSVITLRGGFAATSAAALADTNTEQHRQPGACERIISGAGQGSRASAVRQDHTRAARGQEAAH